MACSVASVLGHIVAELGLWALVLGAAVMIPLTIEVGRKALKRERPVERTIYFVACFAHPDYDGSFTNGGRHEMFARSRHAACSFA